MSRLARTLPVALVILSWGALLSETAVAPAAGGDVTLLGDVEEPADGKPPQPSVQEFPSAIPEGGTGGVDAAAHKHVALGPDNAVPQDKEADLLTRKADEVSVFNGTAGAPSPLRVPSQASSKGYKEVADYMTELAKKPFNSEKATMGAAAAADPQIADLMSRLKGHRVALTKAKKMQMHAQEMKEVLQQDLEGVTLAQPKKPTPLQVQEQEQQVAQLDKAIGHEKTAERAWRSKHGTISDQIKRMEGKLTELQTSYVVRDAKAKTAYLKKLAEDKVDFNMWRAAHTGQDYKAFLAFKANDKTKAQKTALDKKLEGIRSTIEGRLQAKMRQELTSVKSVVKSLKAGGTATNIARKIRLLASDKGDVVNRNTKDIHNQVNRLLNRLDLDTKNSLTVIEQARKYKQEKRVRLETPKQKQKRLSGLYAAGIIGPADPEKLAIQEAEKAKTEKILSPLQYSASTEGTMMEKNLTDPTVVAARKKEMDTLTAAVKKQEAVQRAWEQSRREKVQKYAVKAQKNEVAAQATDSLQMRMEEAKAKYHALESIKVLNKKLASLGGFDDVKEMAAERTAKKEIEALDKKVDAAKEVVDAAAEISKVKRTQLDSLLTVDKANNVLPIVEAPKAARL